MPTPAHTPPVLSLEDVAVARGGRTLLAGLDLQVHSGEVLGISGDNGVGKTTLCRVICQLQRPASGQLSLGAAVWGEPSASAARAAIGYLPHDPPGWDALSVRRNLQIALRGAGGDPAHADSLVELWGLHGYAQHPIDQLSRGWRQRYGLARMDIPGIQLRVLDEPTTGLDAASRELLDDAIARWRGTATTLVTSHDRVWLDGIADEVLEIRPSSAAAGVAG